MLDYNELLCNKCSCRLSLKNSPLGVKYYACDCDIYPLIEGVLVANLSDDFKQKIDHIQYDDLFYATTSMFYNDYCEINSFKEFVLTYVNELSGRDYALNRFYTDSFLVASSIATNFIKNDNLIIDFASGFGHLSFILKKIYPKKNFINIDSNLLIQIIGKRFISEDTMYINSDSLSIINNLNASSIIINDALHYFDKNLNDLLLQLDFFIEKHNTELAFLHVHLFRNNNKQYIDKTDLIDHFFHTNKFYIDDNEILNKMFNMNMHENHAYNFSTKKIEQVDLDSYFSKLIENKEKKDFCINPMYHVSEKHSDNYNLLFSDNNTFKLNYPFCYEKLPSTINTGTIESSSDIEILELFKSGILQILPQKYL